MELTSAGPASAGPASSEPAALAVRLRMAMVRLGRQLRRQDPPGMTVTLHSALATVVRRGELAIGELAEAEHLPSSAATRVADQLEEAGLVVRKRNPSDRRSVRLAATGEGRRLLAERREHGNAWLAGRLAGITSAQRASLSEALDLLEALVLADGEWRGRPAMKEMGEQEGQAAR